MNPCRIGFAVMSLLPLLSAGCEAFGGGSKEPPKEITVSVDPDPGPVLAAQPFPDDAALERALSAEAVLDRPPGSRGREFPPVDSGLLCAARSPDGNRVAVGAGGGGIRINALYGADAPWDTPADARSRNDRDPNRPSAVTALAYGAGGAEPWLVGVTRNGFAQVWRLGRDGLPVEPAPGQANPNAVRLCENVLFAVACHPTRPLFAAAGADGIVRIVSVPSLEIVAKTPADAHRTSVTALAFSADGALLADADEEGQVLLWKTASVLSGKAKAPPPPPAPVAPPTPTVPTTPPATTPAPAAALPAGSAHFVLVAATPGPSAPSPSAPPGGTVPPPPGGTVPPPPPGGTVPPPPPSGTPRPVIAPPPPPPPPPDPDAAVLLTASGAKSGILCLAFAPSADYLAAGSKDGRIALWRVPRGLTAQPQLLTSDQRADARHKSAVRSVTFSPDGRLLASGSSDGTAKLWLAEGDGAEVRQQVEAASNKVIRELSRSPRRMYVTPVEDFRTGGAAGGGFAGEINTVRFTADGLELIVAGDKSVALHRARRLDSRSLKVASSRGASREIDWTRPTPAAQYVTAARLVSGPDRGDGGFTVNVRVSNESRQANADLFQVVAVTECHYPPTGDPNLNESKPVPGLHGRRIHFGKVAANSFRDADVRLVPAEPLPYGDYVVRFRWTHAHQPNGVRGPESVEVRVGDQRRPEIAVAFHLQEEAGGEADGILQFGERTHVALLIKNVGSAKAENVKVRVSPAPDADNPDLRPFLLDIKGGPAELAVGDLKPGEARRKIIGPITIKADGADGAALPDSSLPLKLEIASGGRAPVERTLRIPVGPPLTETAPTGGSADAYRAAPREARESAVVQFRAGPGPETAVIAETADSNFGPVAAEGSRGGWIRVRLPAAAAQRLADIEFLQTYVWVRKADVAPVTQTTGLSTDGLRLVPFGDDTPVIDHNLPDGGKVKAARHSLTGVAACKDGVRKIDLVVDGTATTLVDASKAPAPRVVLPKTNIDFGDAPRKVVDLIVESAGAARHRQQVRVVLEKDAK